MTLLKKILGGRPKSFVANPLKCSFCGKTEHEVRNLVAGPNVYICEECVKLCNGILAEELRKKP